MWEGWNRDQKEGADSRVTSVLDPRSPSDSTSDIFLEAIWLC